MEACPVFIEHVPKIVEMRRNLVLVESRFEPELQRLFDNLEAAGNPWRFPKSDRAQWTSTLDPKVPVLGQDLTADEIDVLYWVGCAGAYDERNQKVARALAGLLQTAGIRFAILGTRETCTGDPARRAGNEYLFQMLAGENVATLNELGLGRDGDAPATPQKTILASCPHCFNTLKDEYPQLGGLYTVRHHAEYLAELVQTGRLQPIRAAGWQRQRGLPRPLLPRSLPGHLRPAAGRARRDPRAWSAARCGPVVGTTRCAAGPVARRSGSRSGAARASITCASSRSRPTARIRWPSPARTA